MGDLTEPDDSQRRWIKSSRLAERQEGVIEIDGWEIDCGWPEQRVALQLDGRPYHVAVQDMEKDRLKDVRLQQQGIRAMRVTDFTFSHDPAGVETDLLALLQLG